MLRRYIFRIFGNQTISEICDREWIISPSCVSYAPSAIWLPGEIEKITGYGPDTNIEHERLRINGGHREHAATIARVLRNADIYGGYIYKNAAKIQIGIQAERLLRNSHSTETKDSAALACSLNDSQYFGHWITDGIPLLMAGRELAPPIRNSNPMTPHQKEYLSILEMSYDSFTEGRIRELIIIEDFGQNQYKSDRYNKIRSRFYNPRLRSAHPGAIILRGTSGNTLNRILINEKQIADYLKSIGFKIINPEQQSVKEIIEAISGARIVVGVEGSQLAHALFPMAQEGTLLVLQPPYRFNNVHKDYTDCMNLKYAFMVGDACDGGFNISMDNLKKTLDLIIAN